MLDVIVTTEIGTYETTARCDAGLEQYPTGEWKVVIEDDGNTWLFPLCGVPVQREGICFLAMKERWCMSFLVQLTKGTVTFHRHNPDFVAR